MSDFQLTTAHDPVLEQFRLTSARPEAFSDVLNILRDHVRTSEDGSLTFTEHDGTPALDAENGYRDFTPETFVAHIRRTRPHIWDANAKRSDKPAKLPTEALTGSETMTELWAKAARGDGAAQVAIQNNLLTKSGRPASGSKQSLTELMIRARNGDAAARAKLTKGTR